MSVAQMLAGRRICVCVGAGGVGKTTTAAAVAMGMAARGARVAVVTIDPARRLADALGVGRLENEPRLVSPARLEGIEMRGELWAMTLDPKRTFDDLIDRLAPSPQRAEEIKRNRMYCELSSAVSGSQEFMAVEKLFELASADYDLLVLDTPPAHSAAEFLNAPGRLSAFLGGGALQSILRPTSFGMRLLGLGAGPVRSALKLVTGTDLIADLTAFFALLGSMTEEFDARARRVEELLHAPETAFLLVTSAQAGPVAEGLRFRESLRERGMPFAGTIVNRLHPQVPEDDSGWRQMLAAELGSKVSATLAELRALAQRDADNVQRLRSELSGEPVLQVPELPEDVHDMSGLLAVHGILFG